MGNRTEHGVVYFSKEEYRAVMIGQFAFGTYVKKEFVNSRLRASIGSLVVGQLDLHRTHIWLSRYRVPHDQEADVFVAERLEFSELHSNVAHINIVIRAITIVTSIIKIMV